MAEDLEFAKKRVQQLWQKQEEHNKKEEKKRLIRIELTLVAWKATVLPLNYRRKRKYELQQVIKNLLFLYKEESSYKKRL